MVIHMKRLYGILILLGIILLFFLPSVFLQKNSQSLLNNYKQVILEQNPQQENLPLIYTPFRKFGYAQLHKMHFPFWNPYIFGGAPFFANDQSAVLSVYTLVGSLFPYNESFLIVSILKLMITGIGMYLLLGLFELSVPACLFGSIAWMFSAFMMTFHIHHTAADAGSFIPWFFYFIEKLIRNLGENKSVTMVLAGLIGSVGLSLFAGHAETTIVGSVGVTIYALTKSFMSKMPMRIIFYTFLGLLLGFLLASVQLVPFLAIILHSEPYYLRSHATRAFRSMPLWTLIMWLVPGFSFLKEGGIPVLRQSTTYIGITALIMALFSLVQIKRYYKDYLPILITMIIAIGIGYVIPPISWLLKVPIIKLGGAFRYLAIAEFSIAVMAGFGLDGIYRKHDRKNTIAGISVIFTLLAIGLLVGIKFDVLPVASVLSRTLWLYYGTHSIGINTGHIMLIGIFIFVILFIFASRTSAIVAGICLLLLSMGDLFTYGMFGMAYNPLITSQGLKPKVPIIQALIQHSSPDYTFYTNSDIIRPNSGMLYGLRDFMGFDIVVSQRYQNFLSALFTPSEKANSPMGIMDSVPKPNASGEYTDLPPAPDPVIASMTGIKYFIEDNAWKPNNLGVRIQGSEGSSTLKPWRRIYTGSNLSLWENPNAKSLLYLADAVESAKNGEEALKILSGRNPDLLHTAIVTGIQKSRSFDNTKIVLTRIKDRAGEHSVRVDASGKGFLVINEPFYAGWHAYMNGKKVPLYHVNYLFWGIKLPEGNYTIKVTYAPKVFYIGLILSVLTVVIVLGVIIRHMHGKYSGRNND